jgi:hypothetical protein
MVVPTTTSLPSATPTQKEAIDLERLHNFPESYEYMVAHPDEFVRSPDPISEKVAFDKWFDNEFGPALGPVEDRPLNFQVYSIGTGFSDWTILTQARTQITGPLTFFMFEHDETFYAVPCVNITERNHPGVTTATFCPIIWSGPNLPGNLGLGAVRALSEGKYVYMASIYVNTSFLSSPDDWGDEFETLVNSIGGYDDDYMVFFGPSKIIFYD